MDASVLNNFSSISKFTNDIYNSVENKDITFNFFGDNDLTSTINVENKSFNNVLTAINSLHGWTGNILPENICYLKFHFTENFISSITSESEDEYTNYKYLRLYITDYYNIPFTIKLNSFDTFDFILTIPSSRRIQFNLAKIDLENKKFIEHPLSILVDIDGEPTDSREILIDNNTTEEININKINFNSQIEVDFNENEIINIDPENNDIININNKIPKKDNIFNNLLSYLKMKSDLYYLLESKKYKYLDTNNINQIPTYKEFNVNNLDDLSNVSEAINQISGWMGATGSTDSVFLKFVFNPSDTEYVLPSELSTKNLLLDGAYIEIELLDLESTVSQVEKPLIKNTLKYKLNTIDENGENLIILNIPCLSGNAKVNIHLNNENVLNADVSNNPNKLQYLYGVDEFNISFNKNQINTYYINTHLINIKSQYFYERIQPIDERAIENNRDQIFNDQTYIRVKSIINNTLKSDFGFMDHIEETDEYQWIDQSKVKMDIAIDELNDDYIDGISPKNQKYKRYNLYPTNITNLDDYTSWEDILKNQFGMKYVDVNVLIPNEDETYHKVKNKFVRFNEIYVRTYTENIDFHYYKLNSLDHIETRKCVVTSITNKPYKNYHLHAAFTSYIFDEDTNEDTILSNNYAYLASFRGTYTNISSYNTETTSYTSSMIYLSQPNVVTALTYLSVSPYAYDKLNNDIIDWSIISGTSDLRDQVNKIQMGVQKAPGDYHHKRLEALSCCKNLNNFSYEVEVDNKIELSGISDCRTFSGSTSIDISLQKLISYMCFGINVNDYIKCAILNTTNYIFTNGGTTKFLDYDTYFAVNIDNISTLSANGEVLSNRNYILIAGIENANWSNGGIIYNDVIYFSNNNVGKWLISLDRSRILSVDSADDIKLENIIGCGYLSAHYIKNEDLKTNYSNFNQGVDNRYYFRDVYLPASQNIDQLENIFNYININEIDKFNYYNYLIPSGEIQYKTNTRFNFKINHNCTNKFFNLTVKCGNSNSQNIFCEILNGEEIIVKSNNICQYKESQNITFLFNKITLNQNPIEYIIRFKNKYDEEVPISLAYSNDNLLYKYGIEIPNNIIKQNINIKNYDSIQQPDSSWSDDFYYVSSSNIHDGGNPGTTSVEPTSNRELYLGPFYIDCNDFLKNDFNTSGNYVTQRGSDLGYSPKWWTTTLSFRPINSTKIQEDIEEPEEIPPTESDDSNPGSNGSSSENTPNNNQTNFTPTIPTNLDDIITDIILTTNPDNKITFIPSNIPINPSLLDEDDEE